MLERLQRLVMRLETLLVCVSLLLLLALTLGQILARNFLETGIPHADTIARLLLLYVTFFGAALATAHDRHIKVDVIAHWLSPVWRNRLFRPVQFLGMVVSCLLAVAAWRFWQDEWQFAAQSDRWHVLVNLILPTGFGLLTLHFLFALLLGEKREHRQT
jgi:TRAP-type C4-dicarboxylate transport system permease small subunit